MKRIKQTGYSKQLMFVGLLGLIVALGACLGLYTRKQRENAPQRSFEALNASLNEVVLATDALVAIDGSQDTSPYAIVATQNSLRDSLETAQKLLDSHQKTLGKQYQTLKEALDVQNNTFDEFQAAYKVLGKAISYNPSLDIGTLDPKSNQEQLTNRSKAAYENLKLLTDSHSNSLSEDTIIALNNTVNCFGELTDLSRDSQFSQVDALRTRCINTYPSSRKQLVLTITSAYKSTKTQGSQKSIIAALTDLH